MYPLGKMVETKLRKVFQPVLQGLWEARKTLISTLSALAQLRQGLTAVLVWRPGPGDREGKEAGEETSHGHSTAAGRGTSCGSNQTGKFTCFSLGACHRLPRKTSLRPQVFSGWDERHP